MAVNRCFEAAIVSFPYVPVDLRAGATFSVRREVEGAHGVGVVAERSCEPGDPQLLPRLRHPSAAMTSSVVATSARFGTAYSSAAFWKSSFTVDVPSDTTTTS